MSNQEKRAKLNAKLREISKEWNETFDIIHKYNLANRKPKTTTIKRKYEGTDRLTTYTCDVINWEEHSEFYNKYFFKLWELEEKSKKINRILKNGNSTNSKIFERIGEK